jgi:hypothetical protein
MVMNYADVAVNYNKKSFSGLAPRPGVDLIKNWHEVNHTFCKLGHFINVSNFVVLLWKDLAYKKEWVNFLPKNFMRSNPEL